eukprot:806488_1
MARKISLKKTRSCFARLRCLCISPNFDRVTFTDIWTGKHGRPLTRQAFSSYLKERWGGDQPIQFLEDIRDYHTGGDGYDYQEKQSRIIDLYVKEGAEKAVNLSDEMRKDILEQAEMNTGNRNIFVDAGYEVRTRLRDEFKNKFLMHQARTLSEHVVMPRYVLSLVLLYFS